jgi:hypothetical protein
MVRFPRTLLYLLHLGLVELRVESSLLHPVCQSPRLLRVFSLQLVLMVVPLYQRAAQEAVEVVVLSMCLLQVSLLMEQGLYPVVLLVLRRLLFLQVQEQAAVVVALVVEEVVLALRLQLIMLKLEHRVALLVSL